MKYTRGTVSLQLLGRLDHQIWNQISEHLRNQVFIDVLCESRDQDFGGRYVARDHVYEKAREVLNE